jgi:hypothetical protein
MLLDIIKRAQQQVPAVRFALGVAGIAAAGAVVTALLGQGRVSIIVLGGVFVAMILLFAFSRLVASNSPSVNAAGTVLLWAVIVFFCSFLVFTTTAFAFYWPRAWADFIGVPNGQSDFKQAVLRDFEVPDHISKQFRSIISLPNAGAVRLQPPSVNPIVKAQRESVFRGGGSYYSFVRRTHDYGQGSDIEYSEGVLHNGFAGMDYGFFLSLGQRDADSLAAFQQSPPIWLSADRKGAWDYMWTYRPPTKSKEIRVAQRNSDGFVIDGVNLSRGMKPTVGGLYLLRSINFRDSDILVALYHATVLSDNSIVLVYRIVSQFDTPITTDREE